MMPVVPETYKALVYENWGPIEKVLKVTEAKTTPLPPSHVRIQVRSAALNPADYKLAEANRLILTTTPPSKEQPYGVGFDLAGVVVETGSQVATEFQVGDEVYAMTSFDDFGTLAEYVSLKAEYVVRKPTTLDFDNAASVPSVAMTSYQALKNYVKLQTKERILILGGSSSTGIFAIQFAKSLGAYVIATTSTKNIAFVKNLGADEVVDYMTDKWGDVIDDHSVDAIYDCGVEPLSWEDSAQHVLRKDTGRFVTLSPGMTPSDAKFGASYASVFVRTSQSDLEEIAKLIDAGKVKSFIDSIFSFENACDAFTRLKTGRAVGKVVIKIV